MDPDIALVTGFGLAILALPSAIAALAESRAPRLSAVLLVGAGALVIHALRTREGGYTLEEIPILIYTMIATARDAMF